MKNLELKVRVPSLDAVVVPGDSVGRREELTQVDTYFEVPRGRLKLREIFSRGSGAPHTAQLISYERNEGGGERWSSYTIFPVSDPKTLRSMLSDTLGVAGEVRKHHLVLLIDNVRIHLDSVEGLGSFVEVEAVDAGDAADAWRRYERVVSLLGLGRFPEVKCSYLDLIARTH